MLNRIKFKDNVPQMINFLSTMLVTFYELLKYLKVSKLHLFLLPAHSSTPFKATGMEIMGDCSLYYSVSELLFFNSAIMYGSYFLI